MAYRITVIPGDGIGLARIDSPLEVEQYRHGGILPYILRRLAAVAL